MIDYLLLLYNLCKLNELGKMYSYWLEFKDDFSLSLLIIEINLLFYLKNNELKIIIHFW